MKSFHNYGKARRGSCLEDGCAHAEDHQRWTRRDFLAGLGLTAGGSLMVGATPVTALGHSSLLGQLHHASSDRILVIIQLFGGNDGLNTIVPKEDDRYYNVRPTLAIPKQATLPLTSELGLHPAMLAVRDLYQSGEMAIVQSVGYKDASLSHFRGTDVWLSGSDSDTYLNTGWTGRQLEMAYPNFDVQPTSYPPAVQIGGLGTLLFTGSQRDMGISVTNPALFSRLANSGKYYDEQQVPATPFGEEMAYVRRVANDTFRYGRAIQGASSVGINHVQYPGQNYLAQNLAIVARLIKGGLGSHIYHVGIGGFDTHGSQGGINGVHATLLTRLSEAVEAFLRDIAAGGRRDDVLVMTFSEFGRRVEQNGSSGTDHGTAAPLFLFGPGTIGGLYGNTPSLTDLDNNGNLKYETDFKAIYSTVLQHWFGFSLSASAAVLGHSYDPLALVRDPSDVLVTDRSRTVLPESFVLDQNYPNPFNPTTTIPYVMRQQGPVRLDVFDVAGRHVRMLLDTVVPAGAHTVAFDGSGLASGVYHYRLRTPEGVLSRQMALVR